MLLVEDIVCGSVIFAVDAEQIMFAVKIMDAYGALLGKVMVRRDHDHELLAVERQVVQSPLRREVGQGIDRNVEVTGNQSLLQSGGDRIENVQLDAGMARSNGGHQLH